VEHDPEEILSTEPEGSCPVPKKSTSKYFQVRDGITNQRETTILWNRKTGKPVYNGIVWQDMRVEEAVAEFSREEGQT
jgi:glycerol kinase